MKKILALLCAITLVLTVAGTANAVLFDFEDLNPSDGDIAISNYMTSIYDSYGLGQVETSGALVKNGLPLGSDNYLQNFASQGQHGFLIHFLDRPLKSVSFDWGVELDEFHFEADGVEVFSQPYGGSVSGYSGTIVFSDWGLGPVTTLYFHDNGIGTVQVDNLEVIPQPEPATLLLLGSGLIGFAGVGRKRLLKRQHNA